MELGATPPPLDRSSSPAGSLARQVARARVWLPAAIIGVVLGLELAIVPRIAGDAGVWFRIAFYALAGPAATAATLTWIVGEVRARERAQEQLAATFGELQESHAMVSAIQQVTERFAAARDLEETVDAAVRGVRTTTGADGVAVFLGGEDGEPAGADGLSEAALEAVRRTAARSGPVAGRGRTSRGVCPAAYVPDVGWIVGAPVARGSDVAGSVYAVFTDDPDRRAREAFGILVSEFASASEAAHARMRDLLTLFDVDRSIRAEGNLERLLGTLLDSTLERVGGSRGAVYLTDGESVLKPSVVRPEGTALAPLRRDFGGLAGLAAGERPRIVRTISDELRADAPPLLDGAASLVVLPLHADSEGIGGVVLAVDRPEPVPDAQLPFLTLLAGQVALAVRTARAYLHSEELAIGEERSRIAREIHDGVAQSLAFAALKIDLGRKLVDRDADRSRDELAQAADTVREAIREVRRSIFALRPVALERYGFVETVRRYLADFGPQNGVRVEVDLDDPGELDVRSEAVLFRIFQEAMHNIAKHADAGTVRVRVGRADDGCAFVEVEDDGRGFAPGDVEERVTSAGGLGLIQMRERVEGRGGRFRIDARPGEGTRVRAEVP